MTNEVGGFLPLSEPVLRLEPQFPQSSWFISRPFTDFPLLALLPSYVPGIIPKQATFTQFLISGSASMETPNKTQLPTIYPALHCYYWCSLVLPHKELCFKPSVLPFAHCWPPLGDTASLRPQVLPLTLRPATTSDLPHRPTLAKLSSRLILSSLDLLKFNSYLHCQQNPFPSPFSHLVISTSLFFFRIEISTPSIQQALLPQSRVYQSSLSTPLLPLFHCEFWVKSQLLINPTFYHLDSNWGCEAPLTDQLAG